MKNKLLLLFWGVFMGWGCTTATAQNIDSIKAVLFSRSIGDTTRVNLLAQVADHSLDVNIDSAIAYADAGLRIAQRINFSKGLQECDQVIGSAYLQKNEYGRALQYFNEALRICEASENIVGEASCLKFIGNTYFLRSVYDSAIIFYEKSLALSERVKSPENVGLVLMDMGVIYNELGDYPKALDYYQRSLKIFKHENNSYDIALCLSNMVPLYTALGNFNKAMESNDQCLSIYEKSGNKLGILSTIANTGIVYLQMKNYSDALSAFVKGYILATAIGESYWRNICRINIAEANYYLGNYDTSLAIYRDVLSSYDPASAPYNVAAAQNGLGNVLIKTGDIPEGINHLDTAFTIAKREGIKDLIASIADDLSNSYEQQQDYEKALHYSRISHKYHDSIYNDKNDKLIHQLEFDEALGEKDNQIKLLEKDDVIKQKIVESAIIMLVMAVTIGILLFINYKKSRKNLFAVTQLKEELEKKNQEQGRILDAVAHDLRSPISGIVSLSGLLLNREDALNGTEKSVKMIKSTSQSALTLINELMNYRNEAMDNINKEDVDLVKLIEETVMLMELRASEKQQQLLAHLPQMPVIIRLDREKIKRVLTNIIGNAIKFTLPGGSIDVTLTKNRNNNAVIEIKDTGIGIPLDMQDTVFELFPESKRKGTLGEKSFGLGLSIAKQIVTAHNGKIWFQSQEEKGTSVYVELTA